MVDVVFSAMVVALAVVWPLLVVRVAVPLVVGVGLLVVIPLTLVVDSGVVTLPVGATVVEFVALVLFRAHTSRVPTVTRNKRPHSITFAMISPISLNDQRKIYQLFCF